MLKRLSGLPILIFIALIEPLHAIAQQTQPASQPPQGYYWPGPWHMWNGDYGWSFWWMFPMMMLFMFFFCAVIFFFGWGLCFHGSHWWGRSSYMMDRPWSDPSHSALQILNERFAKGEIKKEEYAEKKAMILSGGQR